MTYKYIHTQVYSICTQTYKFTQIHIIIIHLRTLTLIHRCKIANKVIRYLNN